MPRAQAWNDAGHMLVALVAWDQMDAPTRTWATELLTHHPRFEQDFSRRIPSEVKDAGDDVRNRWIFAHAATWPDIARGFDGADRDRFHHPSWHYALGLFPLNDRDTAASAKLPTSRPKAKPSDIHLLEALTNAIADLKKSDASPEEKAVTLCWVLHLIGDIHQPLHAGALVSERFGLPDGDRGGNNTLVDADGRPTNLHSVWDGIAGENHAMFILNLKTARMLVDPTLARTALPELSQHPAPDGWLAESADLARDMAYDFSVRAAIRLQEVDPKAAFVPLHLSRNYTIDAQLTAQRRIALAGYRLADTLRPAGK